MEYFQDDLQWSYRAKKSLRVIIVGAGIGGLTAALGLKKCGHDVVVIEQVAEIKEVGAGLQMAPNAARVLGRLGLLKEVMQHANILKSNSLRRYADNRVLGKAPLMPKVAEKYHAPLAVIHRGDLQRILLQGAKDAGVEIITSTRIVEADSEFKARVKSADGQWFEGDVVIGADGIKSDLRRQIAAHHGVTDHSTSTGDAAYRVVIPKEKMQHDQEALKLLATNVGMRWMGPGGHIMAYPMKNGNVYNMVLLHPQRLGSENIESWTNKGDKSEMMDFYKDWNDMVRNLLSYVPEGEVMEWTLNSHRPLPSWIENKVALMGDASHPMLPYVAQGAAQAIEDAGVLTCVLSMVDEEHPVDTALAIYQEVRKTRAESIQASASTTQKALHLPDGPEQQARDEAIAGHSEGGHNPDLWADQEWQQFMWGTDVMKETIEGWTTLAMKVKGQHPHDAMAF